MEHSCIPYLSLVSTQDDFQWIGFLCYHFRLDYVLYSCPFIQIVFQVRESSTLRLRFSESKKYLYKSLLNTGKLLNVFITSLGYTSHIRLLLTMGNCWQVDVLHLTLYLEKAGIFWSYVFGSFRRVSSESYE